MFGTAEIARSPAGRALALAAALGAAALLVACGEKEEALPVAEGWQAPPPLPGQTGAGAEHPHAGMQNPHAGMQNPHAGMQNPHAGMQNPHGEDPHAGIDMSGSNPLAGFDAPDPDRRIDPNKYLRGAIRSTEQTAAHIERGDILFVSAKPVDPASGEVIGAPLAAERLIVSELPVDFELSEANMMVAGTAFTGPVVIQARVDGDGEALTREPGDVEGTVRAEIPAGGLDLVLDAVVQ